MLDMDVTEIALIADYSTSKVAWLHGLDARRQDEKASGNSRAATPIATNHTC
jgi:hypothetical protein